jgi:LPS-assembly lipoprotein
MKRTKTIASPLWGGRKIVQRFFGWGLGAPVLVLLSACGFHPLYGGANSGMSTTLSSIYVEPMPDRLGYEMRNTMIDLLDGPGSPEGATYRLRMSLTQITQGIALQNDAAITRYNDTIKVSYTLTDMAGKVVTSGVESGLSAYNVLPSAPNANYGTLAGQQDADKRAAEDIAERIRLDLNVYFAKR